MDDSEVREILQNVVDGEVEPDRGAAAIWAQLAEEPSEYPEELRIFVGLISECSDSWRALVRRDGADMLARSRVPRLSARSWIAISASRVWRPVPSPVVSTCGSRSLRESDDHGDRGHADARRRPNPCCLGGTGDALALSAAYAAGSPTRSATRRDATFCGCTRSSIRWIRSPSNAQRATSRTARVARPRPRADARRKYETSAI